MKRAIICYAIIVACSLVALGQDKCTLTSAQLPSIRGLRLGMSVEEVLDLIPGSREDKTIQTIRSNDAKPKKIPEKSNLTFRWERLRSTELFAGVAELRIEYFDDQVTNVNLDYGGPTWKSQEEFVVHIAPILGLPSLSSWEQVNSVLYRLDCFDFRVLTVADTVGRVGISHIYLQDLVAEKRIAELKEAALQKMRKEFKP